MNQTIRLSIDEGLKFLASNQKANGQYKGLISADVQGFHRASINQSVFFTALIARCLSGIYGAEEINQKATHYLLSQKSDQWTWNYWPRQSGGSQYPDDLDDTACAISVVLESSPDKFDANAHAQLAKSLISCETQPGGPYATWLASTGATEWRDVDLIVNANIGYF